MSLNEKLLRVQGALRAPKDQHNDFGGYNYRSNEDILNAVKPLLKAENVIIVQSDTMMQIGERYYVCAESRFVDVDDGAMITNTAYAREAEIKKGMDAAQITGSASSYARKYSLNGLLAIDDTKDADTTDNREPDEEPEQKLETITIDQVTEIQDEMDRRQGIDVERLLIWASKAFGYSIKEVADLRPKNVKAIMTAIRKKPLKVK